MVTSKRSAEMQQSPEVMRMSTAAALTLGFRQGRFYRQARLYCINLLLTYDDGCRANCAYCGLSRGRSGEYSDKSFIRVEWPTFPLEQIITAIAEKGPERIWRICLSMVTRRRALEDTLTVERRIRQHLDTPISLLISPTVMRPRDLEEMRQAGADKVGVALDAATPQLFEQTRGKAVEGPHRWEKYWEIMLAAVEVFGRYEVGVHLICGLGETEKELSGVMQESMDAGILTHLFSFCPEAGSLLANQDPPPLKQYRRIQMARYLINEQLSSWDRFTFNSQGQIVDFGLPREQLYTLVQQGKAFMTSGCTGPNGEVACNRPFGNSPPGPDVRNLPYLPNDEDVARFLVALDLEPASS